jgi:Na+-driven multidrug efflux pump
MDRRGRDGMVVGITLTFITFSAVVVDDTLQGTISRPFSWYATFYRYFVALFPCLTVAVYRTEVRPSDIETRAT